jgi:rhodanese-related sulfurtransferase
MRKIKRLLPFVISLMLLSSCGAPGSSSLGYRQISMDEAVKMMRDEKNYIILDVRRPDEFAEGHIPGAINVPNEEIGTTEIAELPNKSQLILVYCRSGRRSKEASEKLVKLGYTNIVEFGGILDYKGEIEK